MELQIHRKYVRSWQGIDGRSWHYHLAWSWVLEHLRACGIPRHHQWLYHKSVVYLQAWIELRSCWSHWTHACNTLSALHSVPSRFHSIARSTSVELIWMCRSLEIGSIWRQSSSYWSLLTSCKTCTWRLWRALILQDSSFETHQSQHSTLKKRASYWSIESIFSNNLVHMRARYCSRLDEWIYSVNESTTSWAHAKRRKSDPLVLPVCAATFCASSTVKAKVVQIMISDVWFSISCERRRSRFRHLSWPHFGRFDRCTANQDVLLILDILPDGTARQQNLQQPTLIVLFFKVCHTAIVGTNCSRAKKGVKGCIPLLII